MPISIRATVPADVAKKYANAKGRRESGAFVALPKAVINHQNFIRLSPRAKALLLDFCAWYDGKNNGDFTTAWTTISARGWSSRDQVFKAQSELENSGFIIRTRQGGRTQCNLFAISFFAIDDCDGKLDVAPTKTAPGDWRKNHFE